MRKITKRCLSILLSLCLVLGMASAIPRTASAENTQYMLHYKYLKRNGGMFGQNVKLEKGKSYTLSYQFHMVAGEYNEELLLKILDADMSKASSLVGSNFKFNSAIEVGEDKAFTTKSESSGKQGKVTYTFTWNGENDTASIVFHTPGNITTDIEFYLADVELYDSEDIDKDNLLESVDENGDLRGWRHPQYLAGNHKEFLPSNNGMAYYRVILEMYQADLFAEQKHMIHYKYLMNDGGMLGQNVELENGKSYTLAYEYSMDKGLYNELAILRILDCDIEDAATVLNNKEYIFSSDQEANSAKGFATKSEGTNKRGRATYTFKWTGTNKTASVLFHTPGSKGDKAKEIEFYFADMTLYEDGKQENLLQSADVNHSLKGWRHPKVKAGDTDTVWTANSSGARYTITLLDYNETFFKISEEKYMYRFEYFKQNGGYFGQTVNFEKGQEYTVSFKYHMLESSYNADNGLMFKVSSTAMGSDSTKEANICFSSTNPVGATKGFKTKDVRGNSTTGVATYTFVWTKDTTTGSIWFHANGSKGDSAQDIQFYFADVTLYESNDVTQENKLPSAEVQNGALDGWQQASNKTPDSGDTEWTVTSSGNKLFTITRVSYDEEVFQVENNMIHLASEAVPSRAVWGQILELKENTNYSIAFRYKNVYAGLDENVYLKVRNPYGDSSPFTYYDSHSSATPFDEVKYDEENGYVVFTFLNKAAGKYGIGFEFAGISEMYLADFVIYETNSNPEYSFLEETFETTNWRGWYKAAEGSKWTCTQSSKDLYQAEVVPYNGTIYIDNCGDANGDREINSKDVAKLLNAISTGEYIESADIDKDGKVLNDSDYNALIDMLFAGTEGIVTPIPLLKQESGGADEAAANLKETILNNADTVKDKNFWGSETFYVSSVNGDDNNDGKSQSKPIKTIEKLNELVEEEQIGAGDKVLFERGSVFRPQETLKLKGGTTLFNFVSNPVYYGAYGEGEKPIISGSFKNFAEETWEQTDIPNVWRINFDYVDADPSVITFDGDTMVGVRKEKITALRKNGDFYRAYEEDAEDKSLYLYMSYGNPADCFDNIEIAALKNGMELIQGEHYITIENINIKYMSHFGMKFSRSEHITVKGCELGWIGGGCKNNDPKSRYGNAIQFWSRGNDCSVINCYIYQVYDAAYTFQGSDSNTKGEFEKMTFSNNLVEYCSMNIEFWADTSYTEKGNGTMKDITISSNILRFAGYGWGGMQRPAKASQAFILGWEQTYDSGNVSNFKIQDNVFDCANCYFERVASAELVSRGELTYSGNTYYQKKNYGTSDTRAKYYGSNNDGIIPVDQATLEAGIMGFDANPTKVQWLE